jgi:hypothetical protein
MRFGIWLRWWAANEPFCLRCISAFSLLNGRDRVISRSIRIVGRGCVTEVWQVAYILLTQSI